MRQYLFGFILCGLSTSGLMLASEPDIIELPAIYRLAYIPATVDPATIRFVGVQTAKLPTKIKLSADIHYCEQQKFRDPGGSMYCPYTETADSEMVYEVQYSYTGPPLASDELAGTYFTFRVYFRRDELPAPVLKALATRPADRAALAALFRLSISRATVPRKAIDEANSTFCEVHVRQGYLVSQERHCEDSVVYHTVSVPSDYWTVQVDLK
jgi:hypothetical protein